MKDIARKWEIFVEDEKVGWKIKKLTEEIKIWLENEKGASKMKKVPRK